MQQNNYVKTIFILYIAVLLAFGTIYFLLLRQDPNHFFIPEEIADKRKKDTKIYCYNRIKELENNITRLESDKELYEKQVERLSAITITREEGVFLSDSTQLVLKNHILKASMPDSVSKEYVEAPSWLNSSKEEIGIYYHYRSCPQPFIIYIEKAWVGGGRGGRYRSDKLKTVSFILKGQRNENIVLSDYTTSENMHERDINFHKLSYSYDKDKPLFVKFIDYVCQRYINMPSHQQYQQGIKEIKDKYNEIAELQRKIDENRTSWEFGDIAYFTIVSLGISNYSDISPNSTTTRLLVLVQQIISIILLVYSINLNFEHYLKKYSSNLSNKTQDTEEIKENVDNKQI